MVAGPKFTRLIQEFETELKEERPPGKMLHHEQTPGKQKSFVNEVSALAEKMEEMGSPFEKTGTDLYRIDTKDVVNDEGVTTVNNIREIGKKQYEASVKERLIERTVDIHEPIKKNKLSLFSSTPIKDKTRSQFEIATLKSKCALFSNLYVSCQIRNGDLDEFFCHENQSFPPSLTSMGEIRSTTKSDLVECLEEGVGNQGPVSIFDVTVIDGAAIVNMVTPQSGQTFEEYAKYGFIPYVTSFESNRIDVVFDIYIESSLKSHARKKRGKGVRRKVGANVQVPRNWSEFLRDSRNKTELFNFLASRLAECTSEKLIVSTKGTEVVSNNTNTDLSSLYPCAQEEADTRIMLHAIHAKQHGAHNILIRTVDTDVLVIAIGVCHHFEDVNIWLMFGKRQKCKMINSTAIAKHIGPAKAKGLPIFHSFTGCDTVSSLPEMDKVFELLADDPS